MGAQKDFEDAMYLYEVTEQALNTTELQSYVRELGWRTRMTDSDELDEKHARNRQRWLQQIREWAEYVRTHPDDDWGEQVNELVNAQLESARHHEDERPDLDRMTD